MNQIDPVEMIPDHFYIGMTPALPFRLGQSECSLWGDFIFIWDTDFDPDHQISGCNTTWHVCRVYTCGARTLCAFSTKLEVILDTFPFLAI